MLSVCDKLVVSSVCYSLFNWRSMMFDVSEQRGGTAASHFRNSSEKSPHQAQAPCFLLLSTHTKQMQWSMSVTTPPNEEIDNVCPFRFSLCLRLGTDRMCFCHPLCGGSVQTGRHAT